VDPAVAPGGRVSVIPSGLARPVHVQQRVGDAWVDRGPAVTTDGGRTAFRAPATPGVLRLRALGADGEATRALDVTVRPLILAAVGDINLGDGPGEAIDQFGATYPWAGVGPALRAADIAFGNLECVVSPLGSPQPKTFTFRGKASSLPAMHQDGGLDVVNLANNHSGDFGKAALLDTLRNVRRAGMVPIGAGATAAAAYRPQIVDRLGLRVAFVGFVVIAPENFRAVGDSPGTAWGFPDQVRSAVAAARREADVVIVSFHWGIERQFTQDAQQEQLARIALQSGATAVIGAHPHVLQPIRRLPGHLIAYSMGNFVFTPHSAGTNLTGILEVELGAGRVLGDRLIHAHIVGTRPVLG
jgi:poly-gamma-glutamate capsule biosynthesis protein CapA/YwtB (metallophosphatase superfamily)